MDITVMRRVCVGTELDYVIIWTDVLTAQLAGKASSVPLISMNVPLILTPAVLTLM